MRSTRPSRALFATLLLLLLVVAFAGGCFLTVRYMDQIDLSYTSGASVEENPETLGLVAQAAAGASSTLEAAPDASSSETANQPAVLADTSIVHIPTPANVHAVYMSQCTAGAPELRDNLITFVAQSDLNAVVIDIKDFSGGISFPTDDPLLSQNVSHECGANDMKDFIASLHQKGIYVIGRITVFQDPTYTKEHPEQAVQDTNGGLWKNDGGLSFVDVGAKPFWDYIVRLSQVAYAQIGFDELNFDYIRYPSDGPLKDARYTLSKDQTKTAALEAFFDYLHSQLQPAGSTPGTDAPVLSADMFGMVSSHRDDLDIGQVLENAFPYFDYIDPMIYPSHYPKGFDGYDDVNAHSSDIVYRETKSAVQRAIAAGYSADKIRPWLQSFDYPVAYTPEMVQGQIDADAKGGADSYLFWDAANKYTSLRQALQSGE